MSRDEIKPFAEYAEQLALAVLSRDNAQVSNGYLTRAAIKRFRTGLRALEAYVKRFLMMLALMMEPELRPSEREYSPPLARPKRAIRKPVVSFRDQAARLEGRPDGTDRRPQRFPIHQKRPAHHLLERLAALRAIIAEPDTHARRLAYHIARHRPGLICPPGEDRTVPRRYGTEVSTLYMALATRIVTLARERPPQLPPAPAPRREYGWWAKQRDTRRRPVALRGDRRGRRSICR